MIVIIFVDKCFKQYLSVFVRFTMRQLMAQTFDVSTNKPFFISDSVHNAKAAKR